MDAQEFQKAQKAKLLACYGETPESLIAKSQESDIEKAEGDENKDNDEDLEKGGEGTKGGNVIGHTISGKPIYKKSTGTNTSNFSSTDHHNAYAAHEQARSKMSKFSESGEKNKDFEHHSKMMMFHKQGAANKSYDENNK